MTIRDIVQENLKLFEGGRPAADLANFWILACVGVAPQDNRCK